LLEGWDPVAALGPDRLGEVARLVARRLWPSSIARWLGAPPGPWREALGAALREVASAGGASTPLDFLPKAAEGAQRLVSREGATCVVTSGDSTSRRACAGLELDPPSWFGVHVGTADRKREGDSGPLTAPAFVLFHGAADGPADGDETPWPEPVRFFGFSADSAVLPSIEAAPTWNGQRCQDDPDVSNREHCQPASVAARLDGALIADRPSLFAPRVETREARAAAALVRQVHSGRGAPRAERFERWTSPWLQHSIDVVRLDPSGVVVSLARGGEPLLLGGRYKREHAPDVGGDCADSFEEDSAELTGGFVVPGPSGAFGLYGEYAKRSGVCEVIDGEEGAFVVLCPASGCEVSLFPLQNGDLGR
ncbi:MAG TPA: hypothetical protein VND93_11705, partial [Myxococcales bacterium]|nr:hypothetical protein [Myxococcales bacterium]